MLEPRVSDSEEKLTKLWKRIDFDIESLHIDFSKFRRFVEKNKADLEKYLTSSRVEMIELSIRYKNFL